MAIIKPNNNTLTAITALPSGMTSAPGLSISGRILQIGSSSDTTERSTTSTSFQTASNTLSVDITPAAASSKFLILVQTGSYNDDNGGTVHCTIYRTVGGTESDLGNSNQGLVTSRTDQNSRFPTSMMIHDEPNTTSAINYRVHFRAGSGTAKIVSYPARSKITVLEIGG